MILNKMGLKHNAKESVIERTLGLFLRDCFEKQDEFKKLKQECEIVYEDCDLDSSGSEDDDLTSEAPETVVSENYNQSSVQNLQSLSSDFSFIDRWDSEILKEGEKQGQILQYLSKLGAPQTQLTYLCQQFGWRTCFRDSHGMDGQFEVSAVVDIDYKNVKRQLV